MKKLLVCDLDGTLLDEKNQIDPITLSSLKEYILTNDFCVCTGRLDQDIVFVEKQLDVLGKYRISQNGAIVRDSTGKTVSKETIPSDLVPIINKVVFNRGLRVEVSDENHRYFPSPRDPSQVAEFVDTSIVKPNLAEFIEKPDFQAVIYLIFGNDKIFKPLIKALREVVGERVNIQQTSPSTIEIFSTHASKGMAVESLMRQEGYEADNVFVAGDAENDTTMFGLTKHSYAVGSLADQETINKAAKHVKTIADVISDMEVLS